MTRLLAALLVLLLPALASAQVPAPWTAQDIGAPALAGSSSAAAGIFTVTGAGVDIWGTADQGQFVSQPFTGDGTITARVSSLVATDPWAKVGLMIRQDVTAGAPYAFVGITPGNGARLQSRLAANGVSTSSGNTGAPPIWLQLIRTGSVFAGARSTDGTTWAPLGTVTVPLGVSAVVGIVATSHNPALRTTAIVDSVSVVPAVPPVTVTATATWTANPEPDVTGYVLAYGTTAGVHPTLITVGLVTTVPVPNLVVGTTYYVVLRAVNSSGLTSPDSAEVVYLAKAGGGPIVISNVSLQP